MRSVMAVVVLVAGFWLASSSGAAAGTYDVYGCRLPDGQPVASGGWSPYVTGNGTTTSSGCAIGGGLTGRLDPASTVLRNSVAGWVFDAAPDTTIENYSLYRSSATATAPSPDGHGRDIWLYHDAAYWEGASPSQ